jgi:hypothetical protein
MKVKVFWFLVSIGLSIVLWSDFAYAQHNPCCTINSIGVPGASISLDGIVQAGEWAGAAAPTSVTATMVLPNGSTLNGTLTVLHKADGIYVLAQISDTANFNSNDTFLMLFDIDNNPATTNDDYGVQVLRGGTASCGSGIDPNTYTPCPAGAVGVNSTPGAGWIVEFHLSTGPPSNLSFSTGAIGAYFSFYDADDALGLNSAKYAQYPPAPMGNPNALLDADPTQWANLVFDGKTTFPDIAVLDFHNTAPVGSSSLSRTAVNSFEVQLSNPGGTIIPDASNVRVNLYLAAKGIGEPWHRMDTTAQLISDCNSSAWNPDPMEPGIDVCKGAPPSTPEVDIGDPSLLVNDIVTNVAKYTIQGGVTVNPPGAVSITVSGGTSAYHPVVNWQLTAAQFTLFDDPVTSPEGNSADRAHECMLAEAVVPDDPNPSNNTLQKNLDFVPLQKGMKMKASFGAGSNGFGKYDPNVGKPMYLQVSRQNMDSSFQFDLTGVKPLGGGAYEADLKGLASIQVSAELTANDTGVMGKVLKQNLVVPAKAGAEIERGCHHHWWCPFSWLVELFEGRDTEEPVYVRVQPNTTLWIVNYTLNTKDVQFVNVDGDGPLPPNGPIGLSPSQVTGGRGKLLVPSARVGELVLSFDNFTTGIGIGSGVQVRVPVGVTYIALAINDNQQKAQHHKGTGFRVAISEHAPIAPATEAKSMKPKTMEAAVEDGRIVAVSIDKVLPQVCVDGYEDIGQKRPLGNQKYELFRPIGNVCWAVTAVLPGERPPRDKGDPPPPNNTR